MLPQSHLAVFRVPDCACFGCGVESLFGRHCSDGLDKLVDRLLNALDTVFG